MVSRAGMSAVYPGFLQARGQELTQQKQGLDIQNLQDEQLGNAAFGRTLAFLANPGQIPGATPIGGQGPMPPQPGQPSMPAQPPQQPPMQPFSPQPMPQQGGGMGQPGGGPPMSAPMSPQPTGGPPGPMQPPGGGQQGGAQPPGQFDWRQVMQKVVQANPGAKPEVIAHAVSKFLPLMTQQAQMEWKTVMATVAQQRVTNQGADIKRKEEYGIRRGDQRDEELDVKQDEAASKAEDRTARRDLSGRRLDITEKDVGSKVQRREDQTGIQGRQADTAEARERRLAASTAVRQDQTYQRLEMQKQNLERQVTQGGNRQALAEWRAVLDAQHKHVTEIINANSLNAATMKPADRKALLKKADDTYRAQIEKMRSLQGRSTPGPSEPSGGPPGAKDSARVPGPTSATPGVAPKVGEVRNGYRFKGGDPNKQESYEAVQ